MNQFLNGNQDLRSSSKFNVMVKVQYTLSRSKGQAGKLGSSVGERPEIAQPALQPRNLCRMGIHHPACIFIKHCSWITNYWLFGALTDSLLTHPSRHNFDKDPLYTKVVEGYVYKMYFYLTCRCIWRHYRSNRTRCKTWTMFFSDQVGCTSISQAVHLLESKELFIEVLINAAFAWHHRW